MCSRVFHMNINDITNLRLVLISILHNIIMIIS